MIRFQSHSPGEGNISQSESLAKQGAQLRATGKRQGVFKYAEGASAFDLLGSKHSHSPLSWSVCVCTRHVGVGLHVNEDRLDSNMYMVHGCVHGCVSTAIGPYVCVHVCIYVLVSSCGS